MVGGDLVAYMFEVSASKLRLPLDTGLKELPDSRERTGTPALWLFCGLGVFL